MHEIPVKAANWGSQSVTGAETQKKLAQSMFYDLIKKFENFWSAYLRGQKILVA